MSQIRSAEAAKRFGRFGRAVRAIGPGMAAMLADTDVGSLITAAQSGAKWGYSLLLLQGLLIPILYVMQELTARLGTTTGKGHGELIIEHYGRFWAWVSFGGLLLAAVGAVLTEFSGLAGIGDLLGVPRWISLGAPAALLLLLVFTGSHKRVEIVSVVVGLFELVFLWIAWRAHPKPGEILSSLAHWPLGESEFRTLVAANIGAVIMPWMIFYQQSSIADKGLDKSDYTGARWDTALGAVLSQVIMGALLVASAATIGKSGDHAGLQTVGDLSKAFTPVLGPLLGRAVLSVGLVAAAFVALNVVALALAWSFGDVTGVKRSLEDGPREAPWFYAVYAGLIVAGAVGVELVSNLVALNITVEVINALLLPLALGLLVMLARRAPPETQRLRGVYKWVVYVLSAVTILAGLVGGVSELV